MVQSSTREHGSEVYHDLSQLRDQSHKEKHFESKLEQLGSPSEERVKIQRVKTQTLGMRGQRDRCECEEEEDATGRESGLCFCCFSYNLFIKEFIENLAIAPVEL